jgi:hypothetical protein
MKINRLLATLLAGMLCFSLLGASAQGSTEDVPDIAQTVSDVDVDDTEITLEFKLDSKDELKKDLTAEDFEFSYGFDTMTVKSIDWKDDTTLSVTLSGEINHIYESGEIKVLSSAFTDGRADVYLDYDIKKPQMIVDYSEFTFEDGVLKIPVTLFDCAFEDTAAAADVTLTAPEGFEVTDLEITDRENGVISIKAEDFESLDAALTAIDADLASAVAISGDALNTDGDAAIGLNLPFASIVPMIEDTSKNADGTVQVLVRLFGYYDSEIKASHITLGGDLAFAGGTTGVTLDETTGETLLSFTIDPETAAEKDYLISGTITLEAGAMTNPWGTPTKKQVYEFSVSLEDAFIVPVEEEIAETAKTAETMGYVPFEEIGQYSYMPYSDEKPEAVMTGTVDLILTGVEFIPGSDVVTKPFKKLMSIYDYGRKVLEFFGWVTPKESANEKMMKSIKSIESQVSNLTYMVNRLVVETRMVSAKAHVNEFSKTLNFLHHIGNQFDNSLTAKIRLLMKPDYITSRQLETDAPALESLAGAEFNSLSEKEQEQAVAQMKKAMKSYFTASGTPTKEQIMTMLGGADSLAARLIVSKATKEIGTEYYHKVVDGNSLYVAFQNACDEAVGTDPNKGSVFTSIDYMANNTYNWESEAFEVRQSYRQFADVRLIQASNLLSVCLNAYMSTMDTSDVSSAYERARAYYTTGAGKTVNRRPESSPRTVGYCIPLKGLVRINTLNSSENPTGYYSVHSTGGAYDTRLPAVNLTTAELKILKERANLLGRSLDVDFKENGIANYGGRGGDVIIGGPLDQEGFYKTDHFGYGYRLSDSTSVNAIKIRYKWYNWNLFSYDEYGDDPHTWLTKA